MIRERIAPCGLDCGKCVAHADGDVRRQAQALGDLLGPGFGPYAQRFAAMRPVFGNYPAFREMLDHLAQGTCRGCRESGCLFQECRVHRCVREQGVDFCFQCARFPCDQTNFPPRLLDIWRRNNERMRDMGLGAYFEWIKDKPRYP